MFFIYIIFLHVIRCRSYKMDWNLFVDWCIHILTRIEENVGATSQGQTHTPASPGVKTSLVTCRDSHRTISHRRAMTHDARITEGQLSEEHKNCRHRSDPLQIRPPTHTLQDTHRAAFFLIPSLTPRSITQTIIRLL